MATPNRENLKKLNPKLPTESKLHKKSKANKPYCPHSHFLFFSLPPHPITAWSQGRIRTLEDVNLNIVTSRLPEILTHY